MTFCARLRRNSAVWNLWMGHHRLGGVVCGVQFNRTLPGEYTTVELTTDQVTALRGHGDVLIEAMTQPLAVAPMPIPVTAAPTQVRILPAIEMLAPVPAPIPVMSIGTPVTEPPVVRTPVAVPQRRSPMPPPVPEAAPQVSASAPAPMPETAEERRAERQRRLQAANKRTKFDKYG